MTRPEVLPLAVQDPLAMNGRMTALLGSLATLEGIHPTVFRMSPVEETGA